MNFDMGMPQGPNMGMPQMPRQPGMGGPRGLGGTSMPTLQRRSQWSPDRSLGASRAGYGGGNPQSFGSRGPQQMAMQRQDMMTGGVRPGMNMMGGPSVQGPQGPNLAAIQAEMQRRQVGAQLGPRNGALAGYMMG